MLKNITYGVIKTYKGIFTKKHIGNVQFLIIPCNTTFMVLNLLGKLENGKAAAQLLLRTDINFLEPFITQYKQEENFIPIEEVPCKVIEKSGGNYSVTISRKGKHLKSNLEISFEPEYSAGNIRIYFIDGAMNLVMDTDINGPTQLKMKATSQRAKVLDILKRFVR